MSLPANFRFGVGSSAYQIEGGANEGNKLPSVWDTFSHLPGKIKNGDNGDVADDFYHRYKEDIALAKELGVDSYRLSFAWTRLVRADGSPNPAGIAFYRSVLTEIRKQGMKPLVTLYHWDLPQFLEDKGGWKERSIVDAFLRYVSIVKDSFLDLCTDYATFNEPQCFLFLGYQNRGHAPGKVYSFEEMMRAVHHVLLSHFKAQALLKEGHPEVEVGFVNTMDGIVPDSPDRKLWKAVGEHFFSVPETAGGFYTQSIYMDPLYLHRYPASVEAYMREHGILQKGDLETIAKGTDKTVYVNLYTGLHCFFDGNGEYRAEKRPTKENLGALNWLVCEPQALYYTCKLLQERYALPIVISENGDCVDDRLEKDGNVHDPRRSAYLLSYLAELERAVRDGIDIRGYYYWSLCDNFEWAEGYAARFGLVYIDYLHSLQRVRKDSFFAYRDYIRKHRPD
jgi:beta-glucosidase